MTTISDERLTEMLADAISERDRPIIGDGSLYDFAPAELVDALTHYQSLRAQGGVRVEEDGEIERDIDELWLRALQTDADADRDAYFLACSKWFQDRHFRRMALPALEASPALVSEEMVAALYDAAEGICRKLEGETTSVTIFDQEKLRNALNKYSAALAAKGGQ